MLNRLCIALAIALPAFSFAGPSAAMPTEVDAAVRRVVDGDTVDVEIILWDVPAVRLDMRVRVLGMDSPEKRSKCKAERSAAWRASRRLKELIGERVRLLAIKRDKYAGRVDAKVVTAEGVDVAETMIREGLARRYSGGRRQPWCDRNGEFAL